MEPPLRMLTKNTITLATISAIVTTGVRRVPMLSFSGNTGGGGDYRGGASAPAAGRASAYADMSPGSSGPRGTVFRLVAARGVERSGGRGERSCARLALRHMLIGVIARPHERSGGDVV